MSETNRDALLKLDELVRIHARGDCDHTGGQIVCLWAIRDALSAALARLPSSSPPDCKGHLFQAYEVCSRCGRTEAAITDECHHCGENNNPVCHWCLRPQAAPSGMPVAAQAADTGRRA
jgi:hypothetical protein